MYRRTTHEEHYMAAQQTIEHTIEHYLGDLVAVYRHVAEAISHHAKDDRVNRLAGAGAAIHYADDTVQRQLTELTKHAKAIGGTGFEGALKHSLTTITGFLTGLYGTVRPETASRMLRDDCAGVSFLMMCTQMLHTTALAVGDGAMAEICRRHMPDLAAAIMAINAVLPAAVVADIGADHVPITNPNAAGQARQEQSKAWREARKGAA
jgi:hypothetical protein